MSLLLATTSSTADTVHQVEVLLMIIIAIQNALRNKVLSISSHVQHEPDAPLAEKQAVSKPATALSGIG